MIKHKAQLHLLLAVVLVVGAFVASFPSGTARACYDYSPRGLSASVEGGTVRLAWSAPENCGDLTLTGYNVYRWDCETSSKRRLNDAPVGDRSFTDGAAEVGHTYVYYVKSCFAEEGESGASNEVKVSLRTGVPAPYGLEAFPIEGAIRLEWHKADTSGTKWGLVGYFVYRSQAGNGSTPELRTGDPVAGVGWNDTSAEPGVVYCYFVTAYYANGEQSQPTNEAEARLGSDGGGGGDEAAQIGPPRELAATLVDGAVVLEWQPPEDGTENLIGYYVYRGDSEYGFDGDPLIDFTVSARAWTDSTLQPDITYTYFVTAVDKNGRESRPSGEVEINTSTKKIELTIDASDASVNGKTVGMDQPPIIVNGRTLLPFRFIAENMGAAVEWDQERQQVTATYGDVVVILTTGSQTALVNGEPMLVNVPPQVVNGRTMVPLRFLANAFGWELAWDNVTRTVTVTVGTQS